ncbi:MAG: CdaR family protein [Defluviitaleaceae bacterium]|nr:CdaR family protein [Defluviitaleaceae bacterium]
MEKSKILIEKVMAFFRKDFHWKLLSVALAFILWFVGVNVNNPIQNVPYGNIHVTVLNRDQLALNNVVLLNEQQINNARVSATIRATRVGHTAINNSRSDNIQASIDLSTIDFDEVLQNGGPVTVPISVDLAVHQDHVSWESTPQILELSLDRHGSITLPVEVNVIGQPQEGFESRTPSVTQSLIRLTAAHSVLDQVAGVQVRVNIDGAYQAVEDVYPIVIYNREGENITSIVSPSVTTVHVRVPILPYVEIALGIEQTGSEAEDFMVTEVNIEPATITVVGSVEDLESIGTTINLGTVDLDAADETFNQTFDIRQALIGTGLSLRADAPTEATASIIVERVISRSMSMPLTSINVNGNMHPFSFTGVGSISMTLRGQESVINALTLGQISASINLAGLGAGTHTVPVSISVPPRVALANLISVGVVIEPPPAEEPPPEPPPPPPEDPPYTNGGEENGEENGNGEDGYEENDVDDEDEDEDIEEEE